MVADSGKRFMSSVVNKFYIKQEQICEGKYFLNELHGTCPQVSTAVWMAMALQLLKRDVI